MFKLDAHGYTWTSSPTGRGKRTEMVDTGVWVIEHTATGHAMVGSSDCVHKTVDGHLMALRDQTHSNRRMRIQCSMDPDFTLYEYPTKGIRQARLYEKQIRASFTPLCILLN